MSNNIKNAENLYKNMPIPLGNPEIFKISGNSYISSRLYEKRGNKFYDVIFINNNKESFIGRFFKDEAPIKIKYNNGKILIYLDSFNEEYGKTVITKVISLYDILDDTTYACSQEEALNLFDSNINTNYLKNKDNFIIRSDIEKKNKLKKL